MSFLFQIRKQAHYSHPVLRDQAGQTSQPNFQFGEQNAGYATISNGGSSKYDKRAELLVHKIANILLSNPLRAFQGAFHLRDFFQTAYSAVFK